jgi:hypothetical protein
MLNRFIGSSLVVTTISSYTLKITVTVAQVTSHTTCKSSNSSSGHNAVPLELRNSSEVNSAEQSRALAYCRQPASTVTPGIEPRWDPWPYICSRLFFPSFVVPPLIKMEGLDFFYNWCSLTTPTQKTHFYCCVAQTTQKRTHVITISPVHWLADCCLATSYKHQSYCCVILSEKVFIEPLPGNALTCHSIVSLKV